MERIKEAVYSGCFWSQIQYPGHRGACLLKYVQLFNTHIHVDVCKHVANKTYSSLGGKHDFHVSDLSVTNTPLPFNCWRQVVSGELLSVSMHLIGAIFTTLKNVYYFFG